MGRLDVTGLGQGGGGDGIGAEDDGGQFGLGEVVIGKEGRKVQMGGNDGR